MTIGSGALRPDLFQVGIASLKTSPRLSSSQSGDPLRMSETPLAMDLTGDDSERPLLLSEPDELETKICLESELGVILVQPEKSSETDISVRGSIASIARAAARSMAFLEILVFFADGEWVQRGRENS